MGSSGRASSIAANVNRRPLVAGLAQPLNDPLYRIQIKLLHHGLEGMEMFGNIYTHLFHDRPRTDLINSSKQSPPKQCDLDLLQYTEFSCISGSNRIINSFHKLHGSQAFVTRHIGSLFHPHALTKMFQLLSIGIFIGAPDAAPAKLLDDIFRLRIATDCETI